MNFQSSCCLTENGEQSTSMFARFGQSYREVEDPSISEKLIAEALTKLSIEEREKILLELHGIDPATEKDPERIARALNEMQIELQRLKSWGSTLPVEAFLLAERDNPSFVYNQAYWLHFLHTEHFNVHLAAVRFIRFLHCKKVLFGNERITKYITFDELGPEAQELVMKGYMQQLSSRDRTGRGVSFLGLCEDFFSYPPVTIAQAMFWTYCYQHSFEPDCSFQRGVNITFFLGPPSLAASNPKLPSYLNLVSDGVPYSVGTLHVWINESTPKFFRMLINLVLSARAIAERARFKLHPGSNTECLYDLISYGIPNFALPLSPSFELKTKYHLEFVEMKRIRERFILEGNGHLVQVVNPLNCDVCLGRGKTITDHSGNLALQRIVDDELDRYISATRPEKTAITEEVLRQIEATGGRFLSKDRGLWEPIEHRVAREKVSSMFRFGGRKVKWRVGRQRRSNSVEY